MSLSRSYALVPSGAGLEDQGVRRLYSSALYKWMPRSRYMCVVRVLTTVFLMRITCGLCQQKQY